MNQPAGSFLSDHEFISYVAVEAATPQPSERLTARPRLFPAVPGIPVSRSRSKWPGIDAGALWNGSPRAARFCCGKYGDHDGFRIADESRALARRGGKAELVCDMPRNFQDAMREGITAVVETATGRECGTILSDHNAESDIAVEMVLFKARAAS